jgi:hypothetical protein
VAEKVHENYAVVNIRYYIAVLGENFLYLADTGEKIGV